MIFSPTEIGSFLRCRRKAWLTSKNGQHLTPIFSPLSLNTGTIVHRAHQLWIKGEYADLHTAGLTASVEEVDKVRNNYKLAVGTNPSDAELLTTHESCHMALAMLDNYAIKYATPLPPEYRFISAEQKIVVDVPGSPHKLQGKLDGLIQHIATGRYDVLERKTYNNRPKEADLQFNYQFLCYIYLIHRLGMNYGVLPCVAYDGMWRRAEVPKGRRFDDLFARYIVTRAPHELAEFESFLPSLLDDMARAYATPTARYYNRRWEGCWDCGVSRLCDSITRGEDYKTVVATGYTQRTDDTDDDVADVVA